jgi:hypothetical protein
MPVTDEKAAPVGDWPSGGVAEIGDAQVAEEPGRPRTVESMELEEW